MLPPRTAALVSRQLAEVHRAAQERLGLSAALAMFALWTGLSVTAPVLTAELIAQILTTAHRLRVVSRRLSARYYNLARAVSAGAVFPDIAGDFVISETITLRDLYSAMADSLNEVATSTNLDMGLPSNQQAPADTQSGDRQRTLEQRLADLEGSLADWFRETFPDDSAMADPVTVETPEPDWNWPEFDEAQSDQDLLAELEKIEQQMRDEAAKEKRRQDGTLNESLKRLERNAQTQGAVAAGKADADVMDVGQMVMRYVGGVDRGRYGWMRVTGPSPCGFCAMLAGRGAVYDTAQTASFAGGQPHDNCHCGVVPVFTKNPYYSKRDKYFMKDPAHPKKTRWQVVTEGLSGKDALNKWRSWLNQQYKLGLVPDQDVFGPAQ